MVIDGEVQRSKEGVVHLMAALVHDASETLAQLQEEGAAPAPDPAMARHPRQVRVLPRSRDFH
jgi:error-prone DNA polymerase